MVKGCRVICTVMAGTPLCPTAVIAFKEYYPDRKEAEEEASNHIKRGWYAMHNTATSTYWRITKVEVEENGE